MKKNLRFLVGAATGLIAAVVFSSCAYDPYYSSTSVGGSFGSGYGGGYGGGSSTSVFVATGNPRWGYDPSCYSYYDYTRRSYYDPYLNGYYPVGYRPPAVYGVAHPYGWRPGSKYCRPPSRVSNVTITNYRNREASYRNYGYSRSGQARQQPNYSGRTYDQRPPIRTSSGQSYQNRTGSRYGSSPATYSRGAQGRNPSAQPANRDPRGNNYQQGGAQPSTRYPSRYNSPVAASQPANSRGGRAVQGDSRNRHPAQQIRDLAPPDQSRGNRQSAQAPQAEGRSRQSRGDDREGREENGDPRGRRRN
jgi:hypothetical protein